MFESLLKFFRKNTTIETDATVPHMSKKEKKEFLSNDFIDRMIRVEQRVAQTFGTNLSYKQTRYYQGLSTQEKQLFDVYMKGARPMSFLLSVAFISVVLFLLSFRFGLTGLAIAETMDSFIFGMGGVWLFLLFVDLLALFNILKYRRKKHFNKKFDILEEIMLQRYHRIHARP